MSSSRKIVIEGIHPYGEVLAKKLSNQGRKDDVYIVDEDEDLAKNVSDTLDVIVLKGKMTDKDLDESLKEFDIFVAASEDDGKNLLSCLYVKEHCKVDKVLSIVQSEESEETFANHGIQTVSPEKASAKILLRYMAGDPKLTDRITSLGQTELRTFEIKPELDGKKLSEIPLKKKDYNIVCTVRNDDTTLAKPDYVMRTGDLLQLAFKPKYHKKLEEYFK